MYFLSCESCGGRFDLDTIAGSARHGYGKSCQDPASTGVAYLVRKSGGFSVDRAAAARGVFKWGGEYVQAPADPFAGLWEYGSNENAQVFTDRSEWQLPAGCEWVSILVEKAAI